MENFVVSARKYRPSTFDTVVGQQSITNTLKNAIKSNHLAQAFLFCGPRGVGKTTCARILAKTINCFNKSTEGEACSTCDSCTSFQGNQSLNVYELDAASNNSVDDIRQLVDQVRFAPQLGKYKVYIIDEVHMLSTSAFNAFLKTLEEPPAHAIFILATTEKNKIIPTILSRCQIFDFNRIQIKDMADHLARIGLNENIETEYDALIQIATKADGGLRDALSMFDQINTFAGKVTFSATIENLNILDHEYYFKVTDALKSQQVPQILMLFDEVLKKGFDGNNFINGLAEHFRNLLVSKDEVTLQLLHVNDQSKSKYAVQANGIAQQFLIQFLEICNKCDIQYKQSKNQRLLVELCLLQIMSVFSTTNENVSIKQNYLIKPYYLVGKKSKSNSNNDNNELSKKANPKEPQIIEELVKPNFTDVNNQVLNIESPIAKEKTPLSNKAKQIVDKIANDEIKVSEIADLLKHTQVQKIREEELAQQVNEQEVDYGSAIFSEQQVEDAWKAYAQKHKDLGNVTNFHLLENLKPQVHNTHVIIVPVANTFQQQAMFLIAKEITQFFRAQLKNSKLLVEITIDESLQQHTKLHTRKDIFESMLATNPALKNLYTQFDLDIDII